MGARAERLSATRRRVLAALAGVGLLAAACGGSGAAGSAGSTSSLPPLPPAVIGYVTTIGAGPNVGAGARVVPVDLSAGLSGLGAPIRVGTFPDAIAISHGFAYVANYGSNDVTPIDLATGRALAPIPAGNGPAGIAIAPDGKTAYVSDAGSSPLGDTVTPIDLATRHALAPITVGAGPEAIAITPNGERAYVVDSGAIVAGQTGSIGHTVTPIDLTTKRALAPIAVGNAPVAVAISPDGTSAYVANANSGSVTPIAVATDSAQPSIGVAGAPQAIAISPDGTSAYVADAKSGVARGDNLTPVNLQTGVAGAPVTVLATPTAVAISGSTAYVVCYSANAVVPVRISGPKPVVGPAVPIAGGPYAIALTTRPQGSALPAPTPAKRARS